MNKVVREVEAKRERREREKENELSKLHRTSHYHMHCFIGEKTLQIFQ